MTLKRPLLKSSAVFLASMTFAATSAHAALIFQEDFEYTAAQIDNTGTVNFSTSGDLFHDGVNDYFTVANIPGEVVSGAPQSETGSYTGFSGQFFIVEDIDDGASRPGTQTITFSLNVAGFQNLTLGMLFAAGGNDAVPAYDSNDGFLVRAQLDGGGFQNLLAFEAAGATNQLLLQDTDFDGTGDGFMPNQAATAFNDIAIVGTGASLTLEIIVSSDDGNGQMVFDDIVINGNAVPEPSSFALLGLGGLAMMLRRKR